jgi:hypothetical protein
LEITMSLRRSPSRTLTRRGRLRGNTRTRACDRVSRFGVYSAGKSNDLPDTTRDGDIHELGGMRGVWFKDPDGNIIGLINQ